MWDKALEFVYPRNDSIPERNHKEFSAQSIGLQYLKVITTSE